MNRSVASRRDASALSRPASETSVSIDWANLDEAGGEVSTTLARHFVFEPSDYPALEWAAVLLAADRVPERIYRTGYVQMLRKTEIGAPTVIAVSTLEPKGARRRYRVRLSADQLSTAVRAYENDEPIVVGGVAERDGNLWWMYDASLRELDVAAGVPSVQDPLGF